MPHYKAIISDLDGTLTPNISGAYPSDKVKIAIRAAVSKGIIFSVASARPYNLLEYLIYDIPLISPIIINNGAEIYDPQQEKPIWKSPIPNAITQDLFKNIKQFKRYNIDLLRDELHTPKTLDERAEVFKIVVFNFTLEEIQSQIKIMQQQYPQLHFSSAIANRGNGLCDMYITNGDATKQHAVQKFAELMKINTKEIIGIGDSYNDFPLLMSCGMKIAMGNAVDELKQIADYVAPNVEDDGVADVIEKFIL